jgi:exopolysaccharide production protein ExoQ
MIQPWSSSEFKTSSITWATILLIIVLFAVIEPHDVFRPITQTQSMDSADLAELVAENTSQGNTTRRIGLLALGFWGVFNMMGVGQARIGKNGWLGILLILFLFWSTLSIFWGEDLSLTLRNVVILWTLWLGALGFAYRYPLEDILWLAFIYSAYVVIFSLCVELAWGTFHPWLGDYRFGGVLNPNHQAWNCSLLLLSSVVLGGGSPRGRFWYWLAGLLALLFLILTKSRIATASTIVALTVYWYFTAARSRKTTILLFSASFLCLLLIFTQGHLSNYTKDAISMGRTDSSKDIEDLSGRVPLWQDLLGYASRRAFTGYGFNAFWTPEHILAVSDQQDWAVPGAHSGVLELVLGIGVIGASLFLLILFQTGKVLLKHYRILKDRLYLFCFTLLLYYVVEILAEEIFHSVSFIGFIFFIILMKFGLTFSEIQLTGEQIQEQLSEELRPI